VAFELPPTPRMGEEERKAEPHPPLTTQASFHGRARPPRLRRSEVRKLLPKKGGAAGTQEKAGGGQGLIEDMRLWLLHTYGRSMRDEYVSCLGPAIYIEVSAWASVPCDDCQPTRTKLTSPVIYPCVSSHRRGPAPCVPALRWARLHARGPRGPQARAAQGPPPRAQGRGPAALPPGSGRAEGTAWQGEASRHTGPAGTPAARTGASLNGSTVQLQTSFACFAAASPPSQRRQSNCGI
jgi:hypothetical protein